MMVVVRMLVMMMVVMMMVGWSGLLLITNVSFLHLYTISSPSHSSSYCKKNDARGENFQKEKSLQTTFSSVM